MTTADPEVAKEDVKPKNPFDDESVDPTLIKVSGPPGAERTQLEVTYMAFLRAFDKVIRSLESMPPDVPERWLLQFHIDMAGALYSWLQCDPWIEAKEKRLPCFDLDQSGGVEAAHRILTQLGQQDPRHTMWLDPQTGKAVRGMARAPSRIAEVTEIELLRLRGIPGTNGIEGFILLWKEFRAAPKPIWDGYVVKELRWEPVDLTSRGTVRDPASPQKDRSASLDEVAEIKVLRSRTKNSTPENPRWIVTLQRSRAYVKMKAKNARLFLDVAERTPQVVTWQEIWDSWFHGRFTTATKAASVARLGRRVFTALGEDFQSYWHHDGDGVRWTGSRPVDA